MRQSRIRAVAKRFGRVWRAAAARGDVSTMRAVAQEALVAAARETSADVQPERAALDELLAVQRRLELILTTEAAPRLPVVLKALSQPGLRRHRRAWDRAVASSDYAGAAAVVREALGTLSERITRKAVMHARVQSSLTKLRHAPLEYRAGAVCSFCGRRDQPGAGSEQLSICADCVSVCSELINAAR